MRIAYYNVIDFRRKQSKASVVYNNNIFEKLAPLAADVAEQDDDRIDALKSCLTKLKDHAYRLIQLRYYEGVCPKEISTRLGLSIHNVYKSLSRIQGQLVTCVKKTLASEGTGS